MGFESEVVLDGKTKSEFKKKMNRYLKWAGIALAVIFVGMQLIPLNRTNPPVHLRKHSRRLSCLSTTGAGRMSLLSANRQAAEDEGFRSNDPIPACATPNLSKSGRSRLATQPLDHLYSAPGRDRLAVSGQAARFNPASESRGPALFL